VPSLVPCTGTSNTPLKKRKEVNLIYRQLYSLTNLWNPDNLQMFSSFKQLSFMTTKSSGVLQWLMYFGQTI
jgi:hypothetical protein